MAESGPIYAETYVNSLTQQKYSHIGGLDLHISKKLSLILYPLFLLCAASLQAATIVDDSTLADETATDNWLGYGRTYSQQRFSPLKQINLSTIKDLKLDWYIDLPENGGLVSTPLVVDGVIYFVSHMSRVRAVDGQTGKLIWEYDPKVNEHTGNGLRAGWGHNRGIGIWKQKVFVATWDGRLNAIDRTTGKEVWSVQTFDPTQPLYITGAPLVFKGTVLIGNGGSEAGPNRGYVTAYDAETGKQKWRFYIVPGNPAEGFENSAMEMAAKTWTGEWWKYGGGGNAWNGFTYDPELDQLYIGTGNGSPWNRKIRSPGGGDNLFLCSIIALNPDTGEYLWHYQTTPGESWDYTSTMDIVLADLNIAGRNAKVLMQAPKNGFFYVIDRASGKLLSAEPFVETTWASHIDLETGRPVEIPGARYENGPGRVAPSPWGGHNWHAMSYSPQTGLVYIPAIHWSAIFSDELIDIEHWQPTNFDVPNLGTTFVYDKLPESSLIAWDPVNNRAVWSVPLAGLWNAGTMTTAGDLVFQGKANGTFSAYNAATGDELWSFDTGLGISAPPISFSINDRQYISVLVGWGGSGAGAGTLNETKLGWAYKAQTRRLLTFSLEGKAQLPQAPAPAPAKPIMEPSFKTEAALVRQGSMEYIRCVACHGIDAISTGMAPDLRASSIVLSGEAFTDIVRNGSRLKFGMPKYSQLTDEQLLAIRHYIREQAQQSSKLQ